MLVAARPDWPHIRLLSEVADPPVAAEWMNEDRAEVTLRTGGRLSVDRDAGVARFAIPRRLDDEELIHPYLAPVAAVLSHWHGRLSFHAGAFVAGGGVWGLVGDREVGKSSLLAWLALQGHQVVADDVLVLGDGTAYAGPRSIDLRRGTAERFGIGQALGVVGARPRWRVVLPDLESELPFRGWVFLAWGDRVEAEALSGSGRISRLMDNLTLRMAPTEPAALVELATLPAFELRRPRDWALLGETTERLLALTS
jgi:hypothetical protein